MIPRVDPLAHVQIKVEEVRSVMEKNMKATVERGACLEDMEHKAEELDEGARGFYTGTRKVRKHFCMRYYCKVLIGLLLLAALGTTIYFVAKFK